jgi:hypothetical protein
MTAAVAAAVATVAATATRLPERLAAMGGLELGGPLGVVMKETTATMATNNKVMVSQLPKEHHTAVHQRARGDIGNGGQMDICV